MTNAISTFIGLSYHRARPQGGPKGLGRRFPLKQGTFEAIKKDIRISEILVVGVEAVTAFLTFCLIGSGLVMVPPSLP
ncbi:MAG: hypothetical protein K6T17_04995, partial [Fimbriimonadales bacterium]|nr:hypothetical protein [Fimbriimonadales bacterium]